MTVIFSNFLDHDTTLLKGIWEGLEAKVIELTPTFPLSQGRIEEYVISFDSYSSDQEIIDIAIESEEDTLIVCGHGSPEGCFSPHFDYTLSKENKDKIRAKRVIGIWCNASSFARKNNVAGFFSSMFISNQDEEEYMGIEGVEEERIRESERKFVRILNSLLKNNTPMEEWTSIFKSNIDENNEVEVFNYTSLEYLEKR